MRTARFIFFALSMQFFLYNMGLLSRRVSLAASVASLLIFIALSLPHRDRIKKASHIIPAIILILTLVIIARGTYEEVFVFPLLLASLLVLPKRGDHRDGERENLLFAAFFFSAIVLLQFHWPSLWYLLHHWGLVFSRFAGSLIGQEYLLGQTATGVPVFLLFFAYHLSVAVYSKAGGLRYFVKTVVPLLVMQAAVLTLLTPLAILIQLKGPSWDLLLLNPEIFVFAGLLVSFLIRPPERRTVECPAGIRASAVFGVVALVCSVLMILRPGPGETKGKIILYDKGYMNWRVPEYGRYGHKSGGMFGYLPRFLDAAGFDVETKNALNTEDIAGADAVIVINVLEYFSDSERAAVEQFVRAGGSLLALGDHTGVQGIRGPFNDLLEPYGIEFIFDSATFMAKGWGEEAVLMPHPVTHGLYSPAEMDIWVGASLAVRRPARPVVVARYGFSDIGDIKAVDHAYLGNRIYDPGEQLGDIVLVAATDYGKGRVMVFGDTSPFQNGALVTSHRFVTRVGSWLVSGGSYNRLKSAVLPVILFVLAILVFLNGGALLVGVVSLSLLAGSLIGLVPRRIPRDVKLDMRTAVMDYSHFERFDLLTWYDDCTGGLQYNLMRADFFPLITPRFSERQIMDSDLAVIIAPVKSFDKRECDILDRFMEKGGRLIYCCGTEEKDGSRRYLERHGLRLLDVPLTTFTDTLSGIPDVNVNKAWGIGIDNPAAEVAAEKFGYPYMVHVQKGRGGLFLIADSAFLLNKNLEGMKEYFAGNIEFLKTLFAGYRGEPLPAAAPAADTSMTVEPDVFNEKN